MSTAAFDGVVLSGHKQDAVEVPFDPAARCGARKVSLREGRRGYRVLATVNDVAFEGEVVPRARRYWLVLPREITRKANVVGGDTVRVRLRPAPTASP